MDELKGAAEPSLLSAGVIHGVFGARGKTDPEVLPGGKLHEPVAAGQGVDPGERLT